MSSNGTWILEVTDLHSEEILDLTTKTEVDALITCVESLLRNHKSGRLDIGQDVGRRNWYSRIIQRMNPRKIRWHVHVEWYREFASLIFMNEYGQEFRAIDTTFNGDISEAIRSKISHGDLTPHPIAECIAFDRPYRAITEYLRFFERPAWLEYRCVG